VLLVINHLRTVRAGNGKFFPPLAFLSGTSPHGTTGLGLVHYVADDLCVFQIQRMCPALESWAYLFHASFHVLPQR
jgi:hypothetical protein